MTLLGAAWLLAALPLGLFVYSSLSTPTITRHGQALRKPPNTLPLVGNGIHFLRARQALLAWFVRCERVFAYETVAISVPTLPSGVIIQDPRNVDYIFRNEGVFEKGDFVKQRTLSLFGNGIINVDGPLWKAQRKAGLHFLSVQNLRVLTHVALPRYLKNTEEALDKCAREGRIVDLQAVMLELTAQLVGKMAYDMEMHADDDFTVAFDHASGCTAERFQNPLWFLTEPIFSGRFRTCLSTVKSFGRTIVAKAVSSVDQKLVDGADQVDQVSGSLIKSLLAALQDETLVADAALNYLSAGRDTVAQAMTWTLYMLMKHKAVALKLRNAVEQALANTQLSEADQLSPTNIPFAMAVFYETLRLYPPIPLEIKQVQQDATLPDGTFLPRTSVVVFCTWALNRSRTTWGDDADEFRPERWLDADGQFVARGAGEFPVFNGGPRLCLGKRMAELVAVQVIATLVRRFEFEAAFDGERVSKSSLTLPMEGGLPARVRIL